MNHIFSLQDIIFCADLLYNIEVCANSKLSAQ